MSGFSRTVAPVLAGPSRSGSRPDDLARRGPAQECRLHEDVHHVAAGCQIESPQTRCLLHRELQAGHFEEFAPDAFDERIAAWAAGFAEVRKGAPRPPVAGRADLENAELYNIGAGLLKPEEKLKSYAGLYTDEYVK